MKHLEPVAAAMLGGLPGALAELPVIALVGSVIMYILAGMKKI